MTQSSELYPILRIERGWPGHFCLADRCMFRRNTLLICHVTGVRVVISTVGNLLMNGIINWFGADKRYFETKMFHAHFVNGYDDANIRAEIPLESIEKPSCITEELFKHLKKVNVIIDGYANDMHENIVRSMSARLALGERFAQFEEKKDEE